MSPADPRKGQTEASSELRAGLRRLVREDPSGGGWHVGARLRNYFLTGLVIVGPVTITLYFAWWFINVTDAWIKPFVPTAYLPDTYLPFPIPGFGLVVGIAALTLIGALTANLLGRTLISFGEQMVGGMPIVRNVYRALKQIFESVVSATGPGQAFQKVGLIEFPVQGAVVDRVRHRRDDGRGRRHDARRRGGPADGVHADRHRAADRLRLLPAAPQRRVPRHEHRGRGEGDHLGRHGDAGVAGQAARPRRAGRASRAHRRKQTPASSRTPGFRPSGV